MGNGQRMNENECMGNHGTTFLLSLSPQAQSKVGFLMTKFKLAQLTTFLLAASLMSCQSSTLIPLRELPGISPETLAAQGTLFHIEEPLLYNRSTKMGVFVVEILSTKNFEDETHLVIARR